MTYLNEAQSSLLPARVLRFSLQVWQGYRQWLHTGPYAGGMPGAFCCLLSCIVLPTQQNVFNISELSLDPSAGQSLRVVCPYYLIQNSAMGLCCRLNSGWKFCSCFWPAFDHHGVDLREVSCCRSSCHSQLLSPPRTSTPSLFFLLQWAQGIVITQINE